MLAKFASWKYYFTFYRHNFNDYLKTSYCNWTNSKEPNEVEQHQMAMIIS